VKESNGRLKGYYIWPHHRIGGHELIYPEGRRYPKRLRNFVPSLEDKVIYINGVDVGYMLPSVPNFHPETWRGQGIALQKQAGLRVSISPSRPPVQMTQESKSKIEPNIKKRKAEDVLNFGVGNPMNK
jgi:hypothetical protein